MSNESYNEVEGAKDLRHLLQAEKYEQTGCEICIVNKCCCCFFGGCDLGCCDQAQDDGEEEVKESHVPVGDESATVVAVTISGLHSSQRSDAAGEDDGENNLDLTSRLSATKRFSAVGPIAEASRLYRMHRRRNTRTTATLDTSLSSTWCAGGDQTITSQQSRSLKDQMDASSSTLSVLNSDGAAPTAVAPQTNVAEAGETRRSILPPTAAPSPTQSTAEGAASVQPETPPTAGVSPLRQIDVTRYGYELIKVLEVFGVRVVIAATPPGTTGRHPHICIAFRGTSNLHNAIIDAKASMMSHEEFPEGTELHKGFCTAFIEMLPSLVQALREFFFTEPLSGSAPALTDSTAAEQEAWGKELTSVVCTGHSLGGALAMLCAYSISCGTLHKEVFAKRSEQHHIPLPRIRSYTFGSPRLGNDLLAKVYNEAVPESYRITNENDVVPSFGMCWLDHAGREVRINRGGDAVIEGTYMEENLDLTAGVGSSVANHFLIRYARSMDNCLCDRNLKMLSPDCCSFLMVPLESTTEEVVASSSPANAKHDGDADSAQRPRESQ